MVLLHLSGLSPGPSSQRKDFVQIPKRPDSKCSGGHKVPKTFLNARVHCGGRAQCFQPAFTADPGVAACHPVLPRQEQRPEGPRRALAEPQKDLVTVVITAKTHARPFS